MATKKTFSSKQETEASNPFEKAGFTSKRNVTVSSWKWENGQPKFFKVLGEIHEGSGKKGSNVPPPNVCLVRDLTSGTHFQLILGKMIYDALTMTYPDKEVIGKCFQAVRYPVPDANWFRYQVEEIDDPETGGEED